MQDKTAAANSDASWLDQSPTHLVHRVAQCADDIFGAQMKDRDLTPRQLAVLVTVADNEGVTQTAIVERTGIDRSTMADVVRRLQKKGLLQRRRTQKDARAYAVTLTHQGRRLLRTAEPIAKRVDDRILEALPAQRRQQFIAVLQSIVAALKSSSSRDG